MLGRDHSPYPTMSLITISTASINYTSGTTDCQCSVQVEVPTIGTTYVGRSVSLSSADLGPDWTDAQLCAAVAEALEVPAEDVSVAPGPSLPEPTDPTAPIESLIPTQPTEPTEPPLPIEPAEPIVGPTPN